MNGENSGRRERLYRVEAIVLKRRDMGEADRLLTCFAPDRGKITLIAKGTRKTASRKAGHLELFTHVRLLVARGRTWDIVTQAEAVNPFLKLREDLLRTSLAYCVAEMLDRLTGEEQQVEENADLFKLLVDTLEGLCEAEDPRIPLTYYELHLLDLAGFRPELYHCLECGQELGPAENYFHPARGGVLCPQCGQSSGGSRRFSLPAQKVFRYMQSHPFASVRQIKLRETVHQETEELLQLYLTCIMEQSLKSARFLRQVREQAAGRDSPRLSEEGPLCP